MAMAGGIGPGAGKGGVAATDPAEPGSPLRNLAMARALRLMVHTFRGNHHDAGFSAI
jgi:hypothetical protein